MSRKPNFDVNVDERTDGRTEIWTPISHPAISNKNQIFAYKQKPKVKTEQLISAFVFATRIVQFFYFVNPTFQASSLLLFTVQEGLNQTKPETLRTSFLASRLTLTYRFHNLDSPYFIRGWGIAIQKGCCLQGQN